MHTESPTGAPLAATRRITKLPEHLINQIAAGEVIERPSAAVKELVENALDAGSQRIEIRLENGGLDEIQILDDGSGIEAEDLPLALDRHATSKLTSFSDLERIGTYGFRGEALSSIASVALLEIRTKTAGADAATLLQSAPGQPPRLCKASGPQGTLITVRGLFTNVPARQKFLKSSATEFSHCQKIVRELALGNPHVAFSLYHQGRVVFSVPQSDRATRFTECLKPNWTPLHLHEEQNDFRIEALLSPPTLIQDRGECLFFINGRSVRTKTLSAAVRNVYLECLGPHHEPSGVVHVDIRKDWVDVNVHPQKLEVRILRQESLYQWIVVSLRKRLARPAAEPPLQTTLADLGNADSHPTARPALACRYLGQLDSGLLLVEYETDLLLVHPHALHALQLWERTPSAPQSLKSPLIFSLSDEEFARWEARHPALEELGLTTQAFGGRDIAVHSRPSQLPESRIAPFMREYALSDGTPDLRRALACEGAVANHEKLNEARALSLLQQLKGEWLGPTPPAWACRHGHGLYFRLTSATLRKHFEN